MQRSGLSRVNNECRFNLSRNEDPSNDMLAVICLFKKVAVDYTKVIVDCKEAALYVNVIMAGCCQPDHLLGKVISVSKRHDVFVYTGDCVPNDVIHAIVDPSVDTIRRRAFQQCTRLESIAMHAGVKIIEHGAFRNCPSLKRVKLSGVRVIEGWAFMDCSSLEDVEFGDQIETIGNAAFIRCKSLRDIKLRTGREIGEYAFYDCIQATSVELPGCLERIGKCAFNNCPSLRRIATQFDMLDEMFSDSINAIIYHKLISLGGYREMSLHCP